MAEQTAGQPETAQSEGKSIALSMAIKVFFADPGPCGRYEPAKPPKAWVLACQTSWQSIKFFRKLSSLAHPRHVSDTLFKGVQVARPVADDSLSASVFLIAARHEHLQQQSRPGCRRCGRLASA